MTLKIGSILADRYRIDGLLGEGGMGAVYRAYDLRLNLTVAVKESLEDPTGRLHRSTDPQARVQIEKARERFRQEAEVLSRLKHPGLPAVRDHFIIPGEGQFLVMELIEGQDLQVLLKQAGRLSEERVIEIGLQMCDVLKYLHSQIPPVIHRDIKPSNLRVMPDGQIVLVDFGICKVGLDQLTRTAARAISEGFSPPEMYTPGGHTDARSDLYSLGATLLALVTGEIPPTPTERFMGRSLPTTVSQAFPNGSFLEPVLKRAMELNPEKRYQSVQKLGMSLTELASSNRSSKQNHRQTSIGITSPSLESTPNRGEETRIPEESQSRGVAAQEEPILLTLLMGGGFLLSSICNLILLYERFVLHHLYILFALPIIVGLAMLYGPRIPSPINGKSTLSRLRNWGFALTIFSVSNVCILLQMSTSYPVVFSAEGSPTRFWPTIPIAVSIVLAYIKWRQSK